MNSFHHKQEPTTNDATLDEPLVSIQLSRMTATPPEVASIFHLPFSELTNPARLGIGYFRGARPYWEIDVTDVSGLKTGPEGADNEKKESLRIWGLTGWYVNLFLRALGLLS